MAWFFSKKPPGPAKTPAALAKRLVEGGLVTRDEFDHALVAVPHSSRTVDRVVDELERRGDLTNFQAGLVKKGEIENLVVGGYTLLYRNASGSFARVYRAEGPNGEGVALKVLRGRHSEDRAQIAQFKREALMAKRLRHPNVVPILDIGEDGDKYFFTMEFVEGGNLRDFLNIRGKLAPPEAVGIALDIAAGLAHAASLGVTHRDLKPTNVLFDLTGAAKLVDFGLGGDGADGSDLRAVEYSTLEKASRAPRDDPRSDLFFLGGILYELLTGEPPWPGTADKQERRRVDRYRDVRPIQDLDPDLPPAVVGVVVKLMSWNPAGRYQTAAEAEGALRRLHESLTPPGPATDDDATDDDATGGGRDRRRRRPGRADAAVRGAAGQAAGRAGGVPRQAGLRRGDRGRRRPGGGPRRDRPARRGAGHGGGAGRGAVRRVHPAEGREPGRPGGRGGPRHRRAGGEAERAGPDRDGPGAGPAGQPGGGAGGAALGAAGGDDRQRDAAAAVREEADRGAGPRPGGPPAGPPPDRRSEETDPVTVPPP